MKKESKIIHTGEPACQERSDGDHLRFVIHCKKDELPFKFTIELNGIKSWVVRDVPSMNPLDHLHAEADEHHLEIEQLGWDEPLGEYLLRTWDKGNYIPIDNDGKVLSEHEALECLEQGSLRFFLQGKRLVGQFVLLKRERSNWLLMKRHDEFALYNDHHYEVLSH